MKYLFYRSQTARSRIIFEAVQAGLARLGRAIELKHENEYAGVEADVAVHYGLWGNLRRVQQEYAAAGRKSVLIDLGYWGRIEGGKLAGYHRFSVNARHATAYFQRIRHPRDRFRHFRFEPQPFKRGGRHVLLAGMSGKAAWVYGLEPEQWERKAVAGLRLFTQRPIYYRPKPSWKEASEISGAVFADWKQVEIEAMLDDCWAVVTHHGNVAMDALLAGVPAFCEDGLAKPLACGSLERIERPNYPDESARDQLLWDAAYTQYTVAEIAEGTAFRYLFDEGLL